MKNVTLEIVPANLYIYIYILGFLKEEDNEDLALCRKLSEKVAELERTKIKMYVFLNFLLFFNSFIYTFKKDNRKILNMTCLIVETSFLRLFYSKTSEIYRNFVRFLYIFYYYYLKMFITMINSFVCMRILYFLYTYSYFFMCFRIYNIENYQKLMFSLAFYKIYKFYKNIAIIYIYIFNES